MHRQRVDRVPIVEESGKAIGIVTLDDLLTLQGDRVPDMAKTVAETSLGKLLVAESEAYHWWAAHL